MAATPDSKKCPYCAEDIKFLAKKCRYCGELLDEELKNKKASESFQQNAPKNAGTAAVLSFFVVGLGQIYKGHFVEAILLMNFTYPLYFLGHLFVFVEEELPTGILFCVLALAIHILSILDAYGRSSNKTLNSLENSLNNIFAPIRKVGLEHKEKVASTKEQRAELEAIRPSHVHCACLLLCVSLGLAVLMTIRFGVGVYFVVLNVPFLAFWWFAVIAFLCYSIWKGYGLSRYAYLILYALSVMYVYRPVKISFSIDLLLGIVCLALYAVQIPTLALMFTSSSNKWFAEMRAYFPEFPAPMLVRKAGERLRRFTSPENQDPPE